MSFREKLVQHYDHKDKNWDPYQNRRKVNNQIHNRHLNTIVQFFMSRIHYERKI